MCISPCPLWFRQFENRAHTVLESRHQYRINELGHHSLMAKLRYLCYNNDHFIPLDGALLSIHFGGSYHITDVIDFTIKNRKEEKGAKSTTEPDVFIFLNDVTSQQPECPDRCFFEFIIHLLGKYITVHSGWFNHVWDASEFTVCIVHFLPVSTLSAF